MRPLRKSGDMENTQAGAPEARPSDYVAEASFDSLGLSEAVRRAVAEKGYQRPTPVQVSSFAPDPRRQGRDRPVQDRHRQDRRLRDADPRPDPRRAAARSRALAMCPTRELAIQVAQEFEELAKHRDLSVVAIYGGASMGAQLDKLKAGAEIVVGHARPHLRPHQAEDAGARGVHGLDARRGGRDAEHGLLRGGDADPRPPPGDLPAAALLGHRPGRHRADHPQLPDRPGDDPALRRRVLGRQHQQHHLRRGGRLPEAAQPPLHAGDARSRRRQSSSATPGTTPRSSPPSSTGTATTPSCSTATSRRRSASG